MAKITKEEFLATANIDRIARYISEGGDVNVKDDKGNILHHLLDPARSKEDNQKLEPVLRYLIDNGADPKAADKDGRTPLHMAVSEGHTDDMKLLIEKGADPKAADKYGFTPLHMAAEYGHIDAMKFLIEKGADPKAANENGVTPLHMAASEGHIDAMKLLIEKGADLNAADKYGFTPLGEAARDSQTDAMKFLIEKGADPKAAANNGCTPMHQAAEYGRIDAMKLLIENGARLGARDKEGKTPIDYLESALKDQPDKLDNAKAQLKEAVKHALEQAKTDEQRKSAYDALTLLGPGTAPAGSASVPPATRVAQGPVKSTRGTGAG